MGKYIALVATTHKTTHLNERMLNKRPVDARFLPRLLNAEASGETTHSSPMTNMSTTAVGASESELPCHSKLELAESKLVPA